MDIDEMKLGDLKKIAAMFGGDNQISVTPHIGKKCIIRTYASGVHFGTLTAHDGRQVELTCARRLWRWDASPHGISLSEIANHGTTGSKSRVCEVVQNMSILDALEIIPCTTESANVIESMTVSTP